MKSEKDIVEMITSLPNVVQDYPFGEGVAVYKLDPSTGSGSQDKPAKMFALISEGSKPVRVSLKCDPGLAELLREKYESVLPGYHLNKRHWNTIICSGQVPDDELRDLIRHSYELVKEAN
jgi:predicted DNA-binding protein (MmcQ/YjbR family)